MTDKKAFFVQGGKPESVDRQCVFTFATIYADTPEEAIVLFRKEFELDEPLIECEGYQYFVVEREALLHYSIQEVKQKPIMKLVKVGNGIKDY